MPKVVLNVASSADYFIADDNGGVDWLPGEDSDPGDSCGMTLFKSEVYVIVMGNRSYQQILSFGNWAWPDKLTYVFTSQRYLVANNHVKFLHDSPEHCIETIRKSANNKKIWLLGGAQLAHAFFDKNLVDEVILTIIPTFLGNGIKLNVPFSKFDLVSEKSCAGGTFQRNYIRKTI